MTSFYYLDAGGQPAGPLPIETIDAMISGGQLAPNVMIVEVGGTQWSPRGSVGNSANGAGAFAADPTASRPRIDPIDARRAADRLVELSPVLGNLVAGALATTSRLLTVSTLDGVLKSSKVLGHVMVLIGAGLTLVYGLVTAIKKETFSLLLVGIVLVLGIAVAQFVAQRFLDAADAVIANTPSRVSSPAFFECVAMMWVLFALATVAGGVLAMTASPLAVVPGIVGAGILLTMATVLFHPSCVNTEVHGSGSAGEEVIGIVSTFLKGGLKIVPIVFFLLSAAAVLAIAASFFGGGASEEMLTALPVPSALMAISGAIGFAGAGLLVFACLLPMLFYFLFLLLYVNLDVLRAILVMPSKVDGLREAMKS